jgi:hypothetical protein
MTPANPVVADRSPEVYRFEDRPTIGGNRWSANGVLLRGAMCRSGGARRRH